MCFGSGPDWVPASDELFGARPACKGGIGAGLASAWRAGGLPCPEQGPVLLPGGRLGEAVAAALNSISVAAGLRSCRRPGLAKLAIMPASPGAQP